MTPSPSLFPGGDTPQAGSAQGTQSRRPAALCRTLFYRKSWDAGFESFQPGPKVSLLSNPGGETRTDGRRSRRNGAFTAPHSCLTGIRARRRRHSAGRASRVPPHSTGGAGAPGPCQWLPGPAPPPLGCGWNAPAPGEGAGLGAVKASFIAGGGEARPGPAMRRAPLLLLALLLGSGLADSPRGKQRAARPREVLEAVSGAERGGGRRRPRGSSARPAAVRAQPGLRKAGVWGVRQPLRYSRAGAPNPQPATGGERSGGLPARSGIAASLRVRCLPFQLHRSSTATGHLSAGPAPPRGQKGGGGFSGPRNVENRRWGRSWEPRGCRSPPAGTAHRSDPPGRCGAARRAPLCYSSHSASFSPRERNGAKSGAAAER